MFAKINFFSIGLILVLFIISCDSVPLYEDDSYLNLIGTWDFASNTHDDAPWPDNKYIFTDDGYLKIYHIHDSTEYLAGTFKMESLSDTTFTATFHLVGDCNASYHNSDWQGDGTILYCWYEITGDNSLKIGFPGSEWNIDSTKYISFVRQ